MPRIASPDIGRRSERSEELACGRNADTVMPELPEVETVVCGLRPILVGKSVSAVIVRAPKSSIVVSRSLRPGRFEQILSGKEILGISRRGKNILISLTGELTLWVHLKMTGHFSWVPSNEPLGPHDLVIFHITEKQASPFETSNSSLRAPSLTGRRNLSSSTIEVAPHRDHHLRFNDYRRFGRLRLFKNDELWQQKGLVELGPEPLEVNSKQFIELCHRRPRQIKQALLDQSFIAGIGNIYADESLYCVRIHPRRVTTSLSRAKLRELHSHIQRILRRAIRLHGTSVDTYSGVNGQAGSFQKYLLAYGKEGDPCSQCGAKIVREKIGSRSAHYCPRCQRVR